MRIGIHWFRRDLRLADNTALRELCARCEAVVPVFIFDPKILSSPDIGAVRVEFLLQSLESLRLNLESEGFRLIVRHGSVGEEMEQLVREAGATVVGWNRDYEPYARERDAAMAQRLRAMGVEVVTCKDGVLFEPEEVLKPDGTPYAVFTPYSRQWRKFEVTKPSGKPLLPRSQRTLPVLRSEPLPTLQTLGFSLGSMQLPRGGERAARERLSQFTSQAVLRYASQRDFPEVEGTSRLSADLRFGTLSPRQVYAAALVAMQQHPDQRREVEVFVNELIWREFYRQILWHFPHVEKGCFKPHYDGLPWENNERHFAAWCEGRTGFPIVDAAMRQLNQTGWMHNRLRMIVSSFLTKDLLVSWQWGERYFMQKLVDGDLAANNGGWQWSASTGTDAQPYFRIFNPDSQASKFDPQGRFIQRFAPEALLPGYTRPIVDHAVQREKTLRMFKAQKGDLALNEKDEG